MTATRIDTNALTPANATGAADSLSEFNDEVIAAINSHADDIDNSAGAVPTENVMNYSATGDGATDDSEAFRDAIAAAVVSGREVYVPNGTYLLGRDGGNFYCLNLPASVVVRGESRGGAILKMKAGAADSVRLIRAEGEDVAILNLTLDGNKASQTANEHRHGVFADGTTRLHLQRVTSQNFTGDGIYLYTAANDTTVIDCKCSDNDRNGITFGGAGTDGIFLVGGQYIGNAYQQVDSEPGGAVANVTLDGVYIDPGGASNDYVLTCSGYTATDGQRGDSWTVANCVINGPIFVVWCDKVTFIGNRGISESTDKPHLSVYRKCKGVTLIGNHFRSTLNAGSDKMVVHIFGTDNTNGDLAERVIVQGNTVQNDQGEGMGIYVSAAEDVSIQGNTVVGAGTNTPGYWGIYVRSTLAAFPMRSARVLGNHVKNFGSGAVAFAGSGAAQILTADCSHNTFDSDVASVQPIGISFNVDGSGAVQRATAIGNNCTGNTTTEISDYPADGVVLIGGNHGERGIYSVSGDPGGVLTAQIGSMALRRNGGAGTTLYVSEAGGTAWAAK